MMAAAAFLTLMASAANSARPSLASAPFSTSIATTALPAMRNTG